MAGAVSLVRPFESSARASEKQQTSGETLENLAEFSGGILAVFGICTREKGKNDDLINMMFSFIKFRPAPESQHGTKQTHSECHFTISLERHIPWNLHLQLAQLIG